MISVAIVDDNEKDIEILRDYLDRFQKEIDEKFDIKIYTDGLYFLDGHHSKSFDVIFMDIEMPHCNGIDAAKKLREADDVASLIFITNMGQFATFGYDVDAIAFLLKPVNYARVCAVLNKAMVRVKRKMYQEIVVRTPKGQQRLNLDEVCYVQIEDHLLIYHMRNGCIETWQSLKDAEKSLPIESFAKSNKSTIVNFKQVKAIENNTIIVGNDGVSLSRREKKNFMTKFTIYLGD